MGVHFEVWILFFALAGVVGFFADRTSICTVKAVEEVLTTRRAYMLLSFAKTVLWVTGVTVWLVWWLGAAPAAPLGFGIVWPGVFGGVLFGIGAVLNGGCAFSTLTRLGNGNLGMIVTLSGFAAGVAIYGLVNLPIGNSGYIRAAPWIELNLTSATVLGLALTLWMIWEIARLWRTAPSARWWTLVLAPRYRLSTAAAVIGVSNGILYARLGTWSYTHTLRRSVGQLLAPVDFAAEQLSAAMLVGIGIALIVVKWRGGQWRVVNCSGDQCQESSERELNRSP